MKRVVLKSLSLINFKGEKSRTTAFNATETSILGENGTGKTRHFDAFMWLLFGKDSQDRKDYEIKTLIDGKALQKVECGVIGLLDVDGEEIELRRMLVEDWVKPRGQSEQVFKGNHHELFWNDVPLKAGEYQGRINAIIDDSVFKMVTNPLFFVNMKWQDQREQLFQLAGTISDGEIVAQNPEYASLLDKISGKSLSDFKKEIAARKKKLKDELEQIQPRIDQTHKLMPENADFAAMELKMEDLEKQIADIDKAIGDKTAAIRQQYELTQKKQSEINDLKKKQQQIVFDAKTVASEAAFESNALRRTLESNIKSLNNEISSLERSVQNSERELESSTKQLEAKKQEIDKLRQSWFDENAKEYKADDICSCCGQLLPEEKREGARKLFADAKEGKLAEINKKGAELGEASAQIIRDMEQTDNSLKASQSELEEKQKSLIHLNEQLAQMPVVNASEVKAEELPEYASLSSKIKELQKEVDANTEVVDTSELQNKKKELVDQRDQLKAALRNSELIAQYQTEIKELDEKGKDVSQQIANIEREEYVIQNFTKTKIEECERRINGLFSFVRFKLFDYTIEGNESETCVPLVDGVPFGSVNTAGRINAGIDIINALTRFYNIAAPIFIDGRESINRIIPTESQIINLIVSTDKELQIK